jgi:Osmosensitive K+ channel histidine kinase
MNEIERNPKSNRQLKSFTSSLGLEHLLKKINNIYSARQEERIVYQRRETQIRREIENISHDLRTPLTSIIGYVDLIQDPQTEDTEKQEYLQIIKKRARVLQGFIQDFYELSRMEGESYPILLDTLQVQSMVSEVAVAYYHEFNKKNIQVQIDLDEKPVFIIADKILFNRVLNNLVQNALKYAKDKFSIHLHLLDNECIIQFKNDTDSMTKEELNFIFDRFYTGDVTRSNQSTGLGLTISKLLVEKMNGTITASMKHNCFLMEVKFKAVL